MGDPKYGLADRISHGTLGFYRPSLSVKPKRNPPKEFLQGSPGMYAKVRKFEARAKPAAALDTLTDLP